MYTVLEVQFLCNLLMPCQQECVAQTRSAMLARILCVHAHGAMGGMRCAQCAVRICEVSINPLRSWGDAPRSTLYARFIRTHTLHVIFAL